MNQAAHASCRAGRRQLYRVTKNTLTRRAIKETAFAKLERSAARADADW